MTNHDGTDETKPAKCNDCYFKQECRLTPFMANKYCGGPWKNKAEHLKFAKEVIPLIQKKTHSKTVS
jgi:hypothetical protein